MALNCCKGWLALAVSVAFVAPVLAEEPLLGTRGAVESDYVIAEPTEPDWGGASNTSLVVGGGDITPPIDTVTYTTVVSGATGLGVSQTSGGQVDWWYQFSVPAGALLQSVQLEACDTSAAGQIVFGIARGVAPGGAAANISSIVGTGATPGCAFFTATPTASTQINNAGNDYWVFFAWSGGVGTTLQVHSFRFNYRLQVSPAPATATFTDVPTSHPFFRFVEALVAAGITGGCGGGNYCPDNAVTRGQMAVFLSVALGMHFPN